MITSLYSYKGGVGRTQLAANIASYLCFREGKKVLLIDWDLDAPGLHYYFDKDKLQNNGLIELLEAAKSCMENDFSVSEDKLPFIDDSYIVELVKPKNGEGKIDLIPAGFYDKNLKTYNQRINSFNWHEFYDKYDGGTYFEIFKRKLKGLGYDYIFIDSRTGVSDYSGIVNIQIPDLNILIAAPTFQNIKGVASVAENIKNSPYITQGYRKALIMPILSRIDLSLERSSKEWKNVFSENLDQHISEFSDFIGENTDKYLENTQLDYKRDLSYGENVLFDEDVQQDGGDGTLSRQYLEICRIIKNVDYLLKREKNDEKIINKTSNVRKEAVHKKKFKVFVSYAHKNSKYYEIFIEEFTRALRFSKFRWEFWDDRKIALGSDWNEEIGRAIEECDIGLLMLSNEFLSSKYIITYELEKLIENKKMIPIKFAPVDISQSRFFKIQGWVTKGERYGYGHVDNFSFSDLVQFNEQSGRPLPNPNIERYINDLVHEMEAFANKL